LSWYAASNDVNFRALLSEGVPSIKEPSGCSRAEEKRPDGLTLLPWSHGRPLDRDFFCSDTFVPFYVASTATLRGSAAGGAADAKRKK